jgi:hypothetical protein
MANSATITEIARPCDSLRDQERENQQHADDLKSQANRVTTNMNAAPRTVSPMVA